MIADDFNSLLMLCLTSDSIYFNKKTVKQTCCIPMGNNIAPIAAIIYMHYIEEELRAKCESKLFFFVRYIDDVFFVADKKLDIDQLVTIANGINNKIEFTYELPNEENILPFLDVAITYNPFKILIKPFHSKKILHFLSFVQKKESATHSRQN